MSRKRNNIIRNTNNREILDNMTMNSMTYIDILDRFERIALSMFEWVNLPKSMDSRYLEKCLYYFGQASLLYDPLYGFINTKCTTANKVNIYGLPTDLRCYSFEYNTTRKLYTGITEELDPIEKVVHKENKEKLQCGNNRYAIRKSYNGYMVAI